MLEKQFVVEDKHSASEVGSGDLEVLSTPSLIAFMENVAKELIKDKLVDGETTVGIDLNVQHVKATAIGKTVRVHAEFIEQTKTILSFRITAYEGEDLIGKGTHKRAIVQREKFMENVKII